MIRLLCCGSGLGRAGVRKGPLGLVHPPATGLSDLGLRVVEEWLILLVDISRTPAKGSTNLGGFAAAGVAEMAWSAAFALEWSVFLCIIPYLRCGTYTVLKS